MSSLTIDLPESDIPVAGTNRRDNHGRRAADDLSLDQAPRSSRAPGLREGSLSPRPFLLSSPSTWIVLDFALSLTISSLTQIGRQGLHASIPSVESMVLAGLPFAAFVVVLAHVAGLYRKEANSSTFLQLLRILRGVVPAGLALYGLQKLWGNTAPHGDLIASEAILAGAVMFLGRVLWRRRRDGLYRRDISLRNYLIVGADEVGRDVRLYLNSQSTSGYRFKGFVSMCEPSDGGHVAGDEEIVGEIHNVIEIARSQFVDEIVFSRRPSTPGVLSQIIHQAQSLGISIRIIPSLAETLIDRTDVQYIGDLATIAVFQAKQRPLSLFVKRAMDIALATTALIALVPVILVVAIAIKLQSPGPVFYLSKRVGHKGRIFTCFKFRTMVANAAAMQEQLSHLNERKRVLFKIPNDPRATRIGAVLRKYSLDELPQLLNVVRGDMSLVGPRPSLGSEVNQYEADHMHRLNAVPGITGLWQVEARQDPSFETYIALDRKYVNHWSLGLDLRILVRTFAVVFRGTGS